jgi:hypothetical protein
MSAVTGPAWLRDLAGVGNLRPGKLVQGLLPRRVLTQARDTSTNSAFYGHVESEDTSRTFSEAIITATYGPGCRHINRPV